jgi:hypothetical protein
MYLAAVEIMEARGIGLCKARYDLYIVFFSGKAPCLISKRYALFQNKLTECGDCSTGGITHWRRLLETAWPTEEDIQKIVQGGGDAGTKLK